MLSEGSISKISILKDRTLASPARRFSSYIDPTLGPLLKIRTKELDGTELVRKQLATSRITSSTIVTMLPTSMVETH